MPQHKMYVCYMLWLHYFQMQKTLQERDSFTSNSFSHILSYFHTSYADNIVDCSIKHIVHCWEVEDAFKRLPLAAFIGSTSGSDNTRKKSKIYLKPEKLQFCQNSHCTFFSIVRWRWDNKTGLLIEFVAQKRTLFAICFDFFQEHYKSLCLFSICDINWGTLSPVDIFSCANFLC